MDETGERVKRELKPWNAVLSAQDDDYLDLSQTPAIAAMLGDQPATKEEAEAIREAQAKYNALYRRGEVTQAEIDELIAGACTKLLTEEVARRLEMMDRVPDGAGGWIPTDSLQSGEVIACTDAIEDVLSAIRRSAAVKDVLQFPWRGRNRKNPRKISAIKVAAIEVLRLLDFVISFQDEGRYDMKKGNAWKNAIEAFDSDAATVSSASYQFVYRGELITRQDLGNMLYGYMAAANRYPLDMIYLAGSVYGNLRDGNLNPLEWNWSRDEYFGDDADDGESIAKGYRMYWEDRYAR